jgi:hypothetical protein
MVAYWSCVDFLTTSNLFSYAFRQDIFPAPGIHIKTERDRETDESENQFECNHCFFATIKKTGTANNDKPINWLVPWL